MAIWAPSKLSFHNQWLRWSSIPSNSNVANAIEAVTVRLCKRRKTKTKTMKSGVLSIAVNCSRLQLNPNAQQQEDDSEIFKEEEDEDVGILCEPCKGRGWLICDFCKGQKTNVISENNRIYRRCPNCRAVGYVLCSKCKVFKCVTYPDYTDGEPYP